MKLYLDLNKGEVSTGASAPRSGRKAKREYDSSFDEENSGVMGGYAPDDPDKGPRNGSGEPLDDELETDREEDAQRDKERGVIKSTYLVKALQAESGYLVKSMNDKLNTRLRRMKANPREEEFLMSKGFSSKDIQQGRVFIEGDMRSEFHDWMNSHMNKSIQVLIRSTK